MDHFLETKVSFGLDESSLFEQQPEDKFLAYLEQASNGDISISDLHAFSIEPKSRSEQCKAALTYLLSLRQKANNVF